MPHVQQRTVGYVALRRRYGKPTLTSPELPRILIVDDERHVREAISTWFFQRGFFVRVAENGARAVEICESEPFDVVLMDMEMPVMKGPEAIKAIRVQHPDLPILVFSGFSADTRDAAEIGANRMLQKPLGLRELESEVRACLSH